jgi:CO dehydrogenase nickel-insertion accessory protein CooC1
VIEADGYQSYLQAGCRKAALGESKEFILILNDAELIKRMNIIYNKVRENTMVVIDGIHRNKDNWQKVVSDERTVVTFDLYYCGIVFFDKKRHKQNYIINF